MTQEEFTIHTLRVALGNERAKAESYEKSWRAALAELDILRRQYVLCPECGGEGSRFYALRGTDTCLACRGTGKRS
jgi:hypothetical protein